MTDPAKAELPVPGNGDSADRGDARLPAGSCGLDGQLAAGQAEDATADGDVTRDAPDGSQFLDGYEPI